MWKFLWGALSTSGAIGLTTTLFQANQPVALPEQATFDSPAPTVIVHLFEWTWSDIAKECQTFLGPKGFKAVQISPPQEHAVFPDQGYPWWQRYQPVSYQLESRSGSRKDLVDMVQQCRQAGVEVYADTVINHMAGVDQGIGSAGSAFTKYSYPGLYDLQHFNTCRQPVKDYNDAEDVTQCELVGLADLNTSMPYVQDRIVDYLSDLADLGITGFRIDAAKHIRSSELGQILTAFRNEYPGEFYIYQEVIDPGTEAIQKQDYYANGHVIDFEYGRLVGEAFLEYSGQSIAQLETLREDWRLAPSEAAVVFIDNHDKQRGHGGGGNYLTHKEKPLYTLANIFMLAYPYGQVRIMSSYGFDQPDQGPPAFEDGSTRPVYQNGEDVCSDGWICEHRWDPITNMAMFRNVTQSHFSVTDWWSNGNNQIAFGRGKLGFVIINRSEDPLAKTFQTQLPPGDYCNVIEGALTIDSTGCTNQASVVSVNLQGELQASVAAMGALAIHVGAKLPD